MGFHEGPMKDASALNWQWLAQTTGTIVILMGVKNLPKIAEALVAGGMAPINRWRSSNAASGPTSG